MENSGAKSVLLIGGVLLVVATAIFLGYRYRTRQLRESASTENSAMGKLLEPTGAEGKSTPESASSSQAKETGPTSGWQTFTKSYHNYTVRVPPDWKIEEHRPEMKMRSWVFFFPPGFTSHPTEIGTEYIGYERQKGMSLKETADHWLNYWVSSTTYEAGELGPYKRSEEYVVVSGRNGIKYDIRYRRSGRKDIWIYLAKEEQDKKDEDYNYLFKIIARDLNDELLTKFNLMLETFKFSDQEEGG